MTFAGDHFSRQASEYAAYRPTYPDPLGAWLAGAAPSRRHVWDCATGSGQAAVMLARHFDRVTATDASASQLANAEASTRVSYRVAAADHSALPDASVDLITVAQAAHWFDLPAFYREARRVLVPGGVLAIWGYARLHTDFPAVDSLVHHLQRVTLDAFWPAGREYVDDEYRSLPFPFERIESPGFVMTAHWKRADVIGYVNSWSAVDRYRRSQNHDPLPEFEATLAASWPDTAEAREIRWPLFLLVGK